MRRKIQITGGASASILAALLLISVAPGTLRAQQNPPAPPDGGPGAIFNVMRGAQGAFLGVGLKDVTAGDVSSMKLPGEYGALVAHVEPDSPAAKAGLRENDVILEFGGMRVWSASQLEQLVRETPAGRTVALRVSRAGKALNLDASLIARKEPAMLSHMVNPRIRIPQFHFDFGFPKYRLGVEVESLTPQLATYFDVTQGKGVLVTEVESGSAAAKAGIKAGDCIVKAGSTEVASVSDLVNALNGAAKPTIDLSIVRSGHEQTLSATLEPASSPMQNRIFERQLERQAREIQRQVPRVEEMQNQLRVLQQQMRKVSLGEV